jgi:hypothetical protein
MRANVQNIPDFIAKPPLCAACGEPMRIATPGAIIPYLNRSGLEYECDCGERLSEGSLSNQQEGPRDESRAQSGRVSRAANY